MRGHRSGLFRLQKQKPNSNCLKLIKELIHRNHTTSGMAGSRCPTNLHPFLELTLLQLGFNFRQALPL